jgi:flagellar hook assembly protein FlgD
VTVDNSVLNQKEGQYTGTITIVSNGGTAIVNVILTATCVLVKPNPYNPNKGLLTFFGDGIVPGETTIKIYTVSGELVKVLSSDISLTDRIKGVRANNEIVWDGKNESGYPVMSGVYLYVYESSKEKGINKFTIIDKK